MRKFLLRLAVICCVMALFAGAALAHPPQSIKLDFNKQMKVLKVTITHNVQNPATHYIKDVKVLLNGKEIIEQKFSTQTDKKTQVVQYVIIDAKAGSTLAVNAVCSIRGEKTETLKVR